MARDRHPPSQPQQSQIVNSDRPISGNPGQHPYLTESGCLRWKLRSSPRLTPTPAGLTFVELDGLGGEERGGVGAFVGVDHGE